MAETESAEGRINKLFQEKYKEYAAHDRTLDALAALAFVLKHVNEISEETVEYDFKPTIVPHLPDAEPYTPDGIIWQKPSISFLLELKSSWNNSDVDQITKYGKSEGYLLANQNVKKFERSHCVLLGYQNLPGEPSLDRLFGEWQTQGIPHPLVVFRYSLEVAPEGTRMFFMRVAHDRNGRCPASGFGRAMNSVRGFPVKADNFKFVRDRFHKANDQVVDSYAAVIWWTVYAKLYLSEDQRAEMAANGRLSSSLIIPAHSLDQVPVPADVEVPLTAKDVRRAFEFLKQAGLVALKKRAGNYEVKLKDDRYVRFPHGSLPPGMSGQQEIATKIITRWATNKIKHPVPEGRKKKLKIRGKRHRDTTTLNLPFPEAAS
jgi:hypothetical protein